MSSEQPLDELLAQLEEKLVWFHSDEFCLEEAAKRFQEVRRLARAAEERLDIMKNDIEVLSKEFCD